jgi:hypothetical protein
VQANQRKLATEQRAAEARCQQLRQAAADMQDDPAVKACAEQVGGMRQHQRHRLLTLTAADRCKAPPN